MGFILLPCRASWFLCCSGARDQLKPSTQQRTDPTNLLLVALKGQRCAQWMLRWLRWSLCIISFNPKSIAGGEYDGSHLSVKQPRSTFVLATCINGGVLCGRGAFSGPHTAGKLRLRMQEGPLSWEFHHLSMNVHRTFNESIPYRTIQASMFGFLVYLCFVIGNF